METLEAVELALCKIRHPLGKLSGCEGAGKVGWLFLLAFERVTNERNAIQWQESEQENKLWGALKREQNL